MSKNLTNQVYLVVNSLSINNITINAPQNITYTWTLPSTIGSSGEFLTTDGTGVLSWSSSPVISGTLTVGGLIDTSLTASQAVFTNASKKLVSVATTGTGNVVLATAPTINGTATFTSTLEATPPLIVTNTAANFTIHVGDYYGPNTGAAGQVYSRHGVNSTVGNRAQHSFFYSSSGSASNYMTYAVTSGSSFRIFNNNSAPFSFINPSGPVSFGAGGISASGPVTATTLNATTLTASQAVFTDASKNLVSVATTGTGNVVLATSPTLVTPVLGAATGTSLNLSGLTDSQAVFTDASKNLVSVATTGTGNVVLATSPTLVTPVLGAATGTSLAISGGIISATLNGGGFTTPLAAFNTTGTTTLFQLGRGLNSTGNVAQFAFLYNGNNDATNEISFGFFGGGGSRLAIRNSTSTGATFNCNLTAATINSTSLTASQAVFTDASKNLVSVANTGTGNNVLATSPTLVTPVLGAATGTSLNLSALTASTLVSTDGSKNLTSVATGTNGQVLTLSGGAPTWATVSAPSSIGATLGFFASAIQSITTSEAVFTINTPLALSQNTTASTGITHSAGVFTNGGAEPTKMVLVVATISTGLLATGFTLLRIYVNSTINNQVIYTTNSSTTPMFQISGVVKMAASDTISVRVISSANTDIAASGSQGSASKVCLTVVGITS